MIILIIGIFLCPIILNVIIIIIVLILISTITVITIIKYSVFILTISNPNPKPRRDGDLRLARSQKTNSPGLQPEWPGVKGLGFRA